MRLFFTLERKTVIKISWHDDCVKQSWRMAKEENARGFPTQECTVYKEAKFNSRRKESGQAMRINV